MLADFFIPDGVENNLQHGHLPFLWLAYGRTKLWSPQI